MIFPSTLPLTFTLFLLTLHATATPFRNPGSTPTCPSGPFPTAPDCTFAYCRDGALSGGDGWCKKLCSCPQSAPAPPVDLQAPPPPPPPPVPAPQPSNTTLDCGNAALSDNPNMPGARNTPGSVQAWCELPGVDAGCVGGKVVVGGMDTDNVCRPLCRCS